MSQIRTIAKINPQPPCTIVIFGALGRSLTERASCCRRSTTSTHSGAGGDTRQERNPGFRAPGEDVETDAFIRTKATTRPAQRYSTPEDR